MNEKITHQIGSPAVGERITSLRYDEAGYVVLGLENGDELWVAACYDEGYHVILDQAAARNRCPARGA